MTAIRTSFVSRKVALLVSCFLLLVATARAEVTVMTSGAFTAAYLQLIPELERVTNGKVVASATSMGTGADSIPSRLQRGERVDVVIVADAALKRSASSKSASYFPLRA